MNDEETVDEVIITETDTSDLPPIPATFPAPDGPSIVNGDGNVTTSLPPFVNPYHGSFSRPMKYDEDVNINDILTYIQSTYGQHYAHDIGNNRGMQVFDLWEGLGSLDTTARDTAIKYLARFGRKNGYNKKDLYKAVHYILMILHATRDKLTWA